jgi:hypothetical protein
VVEQQKLLLVMEKVQHMLEQVGVTAEHVVSRLVVDAGVYHHTQAAVSHNLLEKKVK